MIVLPSGARVWLACGYTDMRKGMDGLAMLAQQVLQESPFNCFGLTARVCACSANGWTKATSSGRLPTPGGYR